MTSMQAASTKDISACLATALGGEGREEARWASTLRLRCRLQPAGGPGAKIMPPTYKSKEGPTYIEESRRIGDTEHDCILLDGVASQANRIESALAGRVSIDEIPLPTLEVDQNEFGVHSGLEFSHRCFDAWIEDAHTSDGQRFGETALFARLSSSPSRHHLTALMETFPVGIVLGCWASRSKNPQGTTRLARILASEIIAVDAVGGNRPASRLDRHHVSSGVKLVRTSDTAKDRFEIAPDTGDGKPPKDTKSPSELGYGNIPPVLAEHGGITMDHAIQIATVSMPALRECGFPTEDGERATERDIAGRAMLTALSLRMLALQVEQGYDLRSGCLLVPEDEPTVDLVGRLGKTVASWPLIEARTDELLEQAILRGRKHGLNWEGQKLELVASDVQLTLLRQSLSQSDPNAK
jgi:CRISPR-associated protein Csb1